MSYSTTAYRIQCTISTYPCYSCAWLASDRQPLILLRVAVVPQMEFLLVPASHIFMIRLQVRRHSTMETRDRHCAAFRSSLAGPCSARWPSTFSLSSPIERVAVHRWPLMWGGLVNRLSFRHFWPRVGGHTLKCSASLQVQGPSLTDWCALCVSSTVDPVA